jgi:hypothetical protein
MCRLVCADLCMQTCMCRFVYADLYVQTCMCRLVCADLCMQTCMCRLVYADLYVQTCMPVLHATPTHVQEKVAASVACVRRRGYVLTLTHVQEKVAASVACVRRRGLCIVYFVICATLHICRVGQNHIYTVYVLYFWQGNHQIYGHIRCKFTVLASPTHMCTQEEEEEEEAAAVAHARQARIQYCLFH